MNTFIVLNLKVKRQVVQHTWQLIIMEIYDNYNKNIHERIDNVELNIYL
jgi:hypothetical protein